LASPLVQVIVTPFLVMSHLHIPMIKLQEQTIMPFIIMQQVHMPPASIVHRFCTMLHAVSSSQLQVIFMPPVHFSILIVHLGTIMKLVPVGMPVGAPIPGVAIPGPAMPGMPMAVRSIIIAPDIVLPP
jgi:hypothetical protein